MRILRTTAALVLSVLLGLAVLTPAQAGELNADVTIASVQLTHRLVLRVDATYICPAGFESPPSSPPGAYAIQRTEVAELMSRDKELDPVVCDGAPHDVRIRFVHPRHPRHGAAWEFGAITQVTVHFSSNQAEPPFALANPFDKRSVITMPSTEATIAADLTIGRVALTDRDALRVVALYRCPSNMALVAGLKPYAWAGQGGDGGPSILRRFENVVCDGTRNRLRFRFAHPRRPAGATWQAGMWTSVTISFFASTSDHTRSVSASHNKASFVV